MGKLFLPVDFAGGSRCGQPVTPGRDSFYIAVIPYKTRKHLQHSLLNFRKPANLFADAFIYSKKITGTKDLR